MTNPAHSLEVHWGEELVFSSKGKWLHPLFELEDFLSQSGLPGEELFLEDKIIGRGAAFLIVRMGIRKVHSALLSQRGLEVLQGFQATVSWDDLVDRIACRTEELLQDENDPEEAYQLLKARAEAARTGGGPSGPAPRV